mmetsp:Transcript_10442/g.40771  ORF Transcript_10442/g.40771 Transcript_10442/m.40771 type:complete len:257 (-) Transcript_10442:103-873(-)
MNSTMETSSVTSYPFSLTSLKPSLSRSGLITCGVCISHSLLRSSVFAMDRSSFASFTVALHLTASTAAPCSIASAQHLLTSARSTRGRAESCMAASAAPSRTSESPLNTESWRSLPGSANLTGFDTGHPSKMSRYEGSHTTTISPTSSISANFFRLYSAMGVPRRGRYCLGMSAFMRLPTPPARRTTLTESFSTAAAATHRTGPRTARRTAEERRPTEEKVLTEVALAESATQVIASDHGSLVGTTDEAGGARVDW